MKFLYETEQQSLYFTFQEGQVEDGLYEIVKQLTTFCSYQNDLHAYQNNCNICSAGHKIKMHSGNNILLILFYDCIYRQLKLFTTKGCFSNELTDGLNLPLQYSFCMYI